MIARFATAGDRHKRAPEDWSEPEVTASIRQALGPDAMGERPGPDYVVAGYAFWWHEPFESWFQRRFDEFTSQAQREAARLDAFDAVARLGINPFTVAVVAPADGAQATPN